VSCGKSITATQFRRTDWLQYVLQSMLESTIFFLGPVNIKNYGTFHNFQTIQLTERQTKGRYRMAAANTSPKKW